MHHEVFQDLLREIKIRTEYGTVKRIDAPGGMDAVVNREIKDFML
jgi:hypothetical protein